MQTTGSLRAAWLAAAGLSVLAPGARAAPAPVAPARAAPARPAGETGQAVQGLTVTTQAPEQVVTSIDRQSYSLAGDLQTSTGSIADALRNVPSVQVDVQGQVSLRGDANVTIMIDGKPSGMFRGPNAGQVLQQIPAASFERVEVITNPSAAFSPEGSAGVINLITKQSRGVGFTGSARANVGTGGRSNGGATAANNTRKLTLSGDAGVRRDHTAGTIDEDRSVTGTGRIAESQQTQAFDSRVTAYNARAGADYDPDAKTRVSGELRYNTQDASSTSALDYEGRDAAGVSASGFGRASRADSERSTVAGSADFRRKFTGDDHEFTLRLSRDRNRGTATSRSTLDTRLPAAPALIEDAGNGDLLNQTRLKAEYKRPLPGGAKLVAGSEIQLDASRYDNFGAKGPTAASVVPDPTRINTFRYDLGVYAAYATYQRPFGKLTVMPGLRLEEARVETDQVTTVIADAYDYLRLYPSLHLQYRLKEGYQINGSYSRRIQRPAPQDLNPFRVYQDPFTYRQGDSRLLPQVTDSFELAFQKRKGTTFQQATLYWRASHKGVTDVIRDLGGGVFLNTKANLAESRSGGLELVAGGRLTKSLTYNLNGNISWNQVDGSGAFLATQRSGWAISGYAALNWQATPKDFLQAGGFATGKRLTPQGYRAGQAMLNLGFRHKFTDKLSGIVMVQDALDTYGDKFVIDTPALRVTRSQEFNLRTAYFGLTYAFGAKGRPQRDPGFDFQTGGGAAP